MTMRWGWVLAVVFLVAGCGDDAVLEAGPTTVDQPVETTMVTTTAAPANLKEFLDHNPNVMLRLAELNTDVAVAVFSGETGGGWDCSGFRNKTIDAVDSPSLAFNRAVSDVSSKLLWANVASECGERELRELGAAVEYAMTVNE